MSGRGEAARPAITQLWREAGGGTEHFNPRQFAGLVRTQPWIAAERCTDCADQPPHLCWWSALGAQVIALRGGRKKQDHAMPVQPSAMEPLL